MDNGNWEIGFSPSNLDVLLGGEQAAMTLWFLAGYLKGLADGAECRQWRSDEKLAPPPSRRRHVHRG
jgi:hypothetical protein